MMCVAAEVNRADDAVQFSTMPTMDALFRFGAPLSARMTMGFPS
jgi:hypothetical protein